MPYPDLSRLANTMNGQSIDQLFKDNRISVITFSTRDATFAIPLEQVRYIEKDVQRNIQVGKLDKFNYEVITFQNRAVPLYDFSVLTGSKTQLDESLELIQTFTDREQDYVDWLDSLEQSIQMGAPFTKATDPNKCSFGVWYNKFKTNDSDLSEILDKFDEPHKKIHALAHELLELAKNDKSGALNKLEFERKTTLAGLRKLFGSARERVINNIRPIIVFVEQNNRKIAALRLDNIKDIESYSITNFSRDDTTDGVMKKNSSEFMIEGFLRNGDKPPCMLINCQPCVG